MTKKNYKTLTSLIPLISTRIFCSYLPEVVCLISNCSKASKANKVPISFWKRISALSAFRLDKRLKVSSRWCNSISSNSKYSNMMASKPPSSIFAKTVVVSYFHCVALAISRIKCFIHDCTGYILPLIFNSILNCSTTFIDFYYITL